MEIFSWRANEHFFIISDMGIKIHNNPVVCDSYVKYEEAEVDRLVAILKKN